MDISIIIFSARDQAHGADDGPSDNSWRRGMITFNVVKDTHGWAIRMGQHMTTTFRSRDAAIREANCLSDAIQRHGEPTEVVVEAADPKEPQRPSKAYRLPTPSRWPQIGAKSNLDDK